MAMNLPDPSFRLRSSTPLVSRSPMLRAREIVVMDGAQFEDDRRRIVVGPEVTDDTVGTLTEALGQLEQLDGMRRWIADLTSADPAKPDQQDRSGS